MSTGGSIRRLASKSPDRSAPGRTAVCLGFRMNWGAMNKAWPAIALMLAGPSAAARQEAGTQLVNGWIAEPGARADVQANVVVVRRGTIRTARLYSDFVFRFEFRPSQPTAEGRVLIRSRFGYGSPGSERGYRVALANRTDGGEALGRISSADVGMKVTGFTPVQPAVSSDGWQACEIRAERGTLTVTINGITVSSAESLDEFTGYLALQARRGDGIEFRNLVAERLPSAGEPFGRGAYRGQEPGVTLPRPLKTAKPFYPREPHDAWIQGVVGLELVVEATGSVGDVRVVKSLHPDLDEAAIASARQWRFTPGTSAGQSIPVIVTMEVSFRRTQ